MRRNMDNFLPWVDRNSTMGKKSKDLRLDTLYDVFREQRKEIKTSFLSKKLKEIVEKERSEDCLFYILMKLFTYSTPMNIDYILTIIVQSSFSKLRFIKNMNKIVFIAEERHELRYHWLIKQIDVLQQLNSRLSVEINRQYIYIYIYLYSQH